MLIDAPQYFIVSEGCKKADRHRKRREDRQLDRPLSADFMLDLSIKGQMLQQD